MSGLSRLWHFVFLDNELGAWAVALAIFLITFTVLPLAKRIYLTEVHARPDADTWLLDFNLRDWRELSRERHEAGPKDQYPFSFVCLERP